MVAFHSSECLLDMQEVTGSSPVPPTTFPNQSSPYIHISAGEVRRNPSKRTENRHARIFHFSPSREPE